MTIPELAVSTFPSVDSYEKLERAKKKGGVSAEDVNVFQFNFYLIYGKVFKTLGEEVEIVKLPVDSLEYLGDQIHKIMDFSASERGEWYGTIKS